MKSGRESDFDPNSLIASILGSELVMLRVTGRALLVYTRGNDDYRVLTDEDTPHCPNDPVLYEPTCFQVLDSTVPAFWLSKCGADGERYAYPSDWMRVGFFEDFHDGVAEVRTQFWGTLRALYPRTWAERHGTAGWGR